MVARFRWESKATRPRTSPEFVFLADAFRKVGAALHPDTWTGKEERAADALSRSLVDMEQRPLAAEAARRRTEAATPIRRRIGLFGSGRSVGRVPVMAHVLDWAEHRAKEETQGFYEETEAARVRRNSAASWIVDTALDGELDVFVRPIGDRGDPKPVTRSSDVFGVDPPLWQALFQRCSAPMRRACDPPGAATIDCYVFLGAESLNKALAVTLADQGDVSFTTGLGGRPTAKRYCLEEMERRIASGEVHQRVKDEAEYLSEFAKTLKGAPYCSPGGMENAIRQRFNEYKTAQFKEHSAAGAKP